MMFLLALLSFLPRPAQAETATEATENAEPAARENILKPFTTDGCTDFPDGIPVSVSTHWRKLWLDCCIQHDLAYWAGGTQEDKDNADRDILQKCVSSHGFPLIGWIMREGVRVGGNAELPTTFRWGYGWTYDRGYLPLTREEKAQVEALTPRELSSVIEQKIPLYRQYEPLPPAESSAVE